MRINSNQLKVRWQGLASYVSWQDIKMKNGCKFVFNLIK